MTLSAAITSLTIKGPKLWPFEDYPRGIAGQQWVQHFTTDDHVRTTRAPSTFTVVLRIAGYNLYNQDESSSIICHNLYQTRNSSNEMRIENWKFCSNSSDDCESADRGEFIDVTLVIKSRGKPKFRSEEEKEKLLNKARAGRHGGHGGGEGHNHNGGDGKEKGSQEYHPRCFKRGKYNKCPKEFDIGG
ncbi:unnamed protein product, partial [Pocillopora meandrina]